MRDIFQETTWSIHWVIAQKEGLLQIQSSCNQLIGKLLFCATIIHLVAITTPASFKSQHHSILVLNLIAKRKTKEQGKWIVKENRNNFSRDRTSVAIGRVGQQHSRRMLESCRGSQMSVCKMWDEMVPFNSVWGRLQLELWSTQKHRVIEESGKRPQRPRK